MKRLVKNSAAALSLLLCIPALAIAESRNRCNHEMLKGQYIFSATGFTRAPGSGPGTPWVPKAIVEVIQFNGDGTLTTPALTAANPFGDLGSILQPPAGGAPGVYSINDDCSGTVQFADAANVTFKIYVERGGNRLWMIQTNPANNVFQGSARRVRGSASR